MNEPGLPTPFVNDPQSVESLPRLAPQKFVMVDPQHQRVALIVAGLIALTLLCVGVVGAVLADRPWGSLGVMAIALALCAAGTAWRILQIRNIAYLVRTHDLSYRSGVLIKRESTVPFVRVQHARIRQGPVQRSFGLAILEVNSAGPDIAIRGLTLAVAEQMKQIVVERSGDLVEDR